MVSDPNWANVKLLLHCDSLIDEVSGSTVTTAGQAAVSAAQKMFGAGSLVFDGSGDYVTRPDSADWVLGAGTFTIELWARFVSTPTNACLICQWPNGWALYFESGQLFFRGYQSISVAGNYDSAKYTWSPTLNQWYAIAVERDGSNNLRIYVNGAMVAKSASYTYTLADSSYPLVIGSLIPAGVNFYDVNGYIDEVRLTKGVARYASDAGYTTSSTPFSPISDSLAQGIAVTSPAGAAGRYSPTAADQVQVVNNAPFTNSRANVSLAQGVGAGSTLKVDFGQVLRDRILPVDLATATSKYGLALTDLTRIASALLAGRPVSLTQGIGVNDVSRAAIGAFVLDRLGLRDVLLPATKYGQTVTDRVRISDALRRFIGGAVADTLGMHDALTPAYRALRALADAIGVHDTVAPKLLLRITAADGVRISAAQALKMVFKPTLVEHVEITAAHVSPNGTITTWVVNTRTGAVTEYGNYEFNSFAQRGHKYLGAASTGLYELDGDDDQGANIIATIKSGWAQFAGSRYSMFKAAYLGIHGNGDVFFKIDAGTGETYTYQVKVQDMQTTKVRMGKGLRARYFAFELVTTGQDFDLDTVEFVPIVAQRRV